MLDILVEIINSSRLFAGFSSICMQIGSRYMLAEIPSDVEKYFNKPIFRRLFLFFVIFIAFRDVKLAMLITLIFILVFNYLLDSRSKIYIGDKLGIKKEEPNANSDLITIADLEKAKKVIKIYNDNLEKQKIKMTP